MVIASAVGTTIPEILTGTEGVIAAIMDLTISHGKDKVVDLINAKTDCMRLFRIKNKLLR